jgi:hypothetical protein
LHLKEQSIKSSIMIQGVKLWRWKLNMIDTVSQWQNDTYPWASKSVSNLWMH